MVKQFSNSYVVCPSCGRSHEPDRFSHLGDVYADGESILTYCPGCNTELKIETKVTYWWTTSVPGDQVPAKRLTAVETRILDHLRVADLKASECEMVGASYGSLKVHISRLRKAGHDIVNIDVRQKGLSGRLPGIYHLVRPEEKSVG